MKYDTDANTPYLGKKWKFRADLIGKMTDDDWCFFSCHDSHFDLRSYVHTVCSEYIDCIEELSSLLYEIDGVAYVLLRKNGDHCTLHVDWMSYACFERAIGSQEVQSILQNIECCFYNKHLATDGSCRQEYVIAQFDLKKAIADMYFATEQNRPQEKIVYQRRYSIGEKGSNRVIDCDLEIQDITIGSGRELCIQEKCRFNIAELNTLIRESKVSMGVGGEH